MANNSLNIKFNKLCKKNNWLNIPYHQSIYSKKGVFDKIVIIDKTVYFVDIKWKYDKLNKNQIDFANKYKEQNLFVIYDDKVTKKGALQTRKDACPIVRWLTCKEFEKVVKNEI